MFKNYFKIAWRNINRNKIFSALNIAGLAISLTAFILMALYIEDELSFDMFNSNAANIYRVADDKKTPDVLLRSAQTAAPVAPALQQEFPEIKQAARLIKTESVIRYNDKIFEERNIFFSDTSLFKIFSFGMLKGNADNALKEPETIVLTSTTEKKYFGNEEATGKILLVDGKPMKITGVMNDIPANSHLKFDFLISMATAEEKNSGYDWLFTNWYSNNFYTYILLPQNYDINNLAAKMSAFDASHKETGSNTTHHYVFEKLTDIYLHSDRNNQVDKIGSITNIYIFSAIALFMLLIASINFINLSTARSATRAKEVGIKKVTGAARYQITVQFLIESFFLCGIALMIAVVIAYIMLPSFNHFSGKLLSLHLDSPAHIGILLLLFLIIGLLAGSYPAFTLSSFKPIVALKGKTNLSVQSIAIRKGLVVFQFAISVTLIVCSIVIYKQMNYLQQHDLGFAPSQTMVINFEGDRNVKQRITNIKQELLAVPGVEQITASSNVPGYSNVSTWSMNFVKSDGDTVHTELPIYLTDYSYLKQYNIPLAAGRGFSENYADDSVQSMLINETALKQLGFKKADDAIGITVGMYPNDAKIIGVIKDFHFESLQKAVSPLAMRILPSNYRLLSLKFNTRNIKQTIEAVKAKWKNVLPERPLEFSFLDENFNKQYQSEIKFAQVFNVFTILAILIACLGLSGLALFSVQQRTKEIGVRKVLGATVANITFALSKDFIKLVIIAIIIATPVAYYLMYNWLNYFAYRATISFWIFIASGLSAILIALITVSFQSIKAALANPVKSLRTE